MLEREIIQYLEWKAGANKKKAALNYRLHLLRFDKFCGKKLEYIKITDVTRFQLFMQAHFAMANVAYATIILKNFFKYYAAQHYNCLDPYLITIPKFTPNSHQEITIGEFIKMDNLLGTNNFYELEKKIIHRLLWETGLRNSELCKIRIVDLQLDTHSIRIKNLKNNKYRWVKWTHETNVLLIKFLKIRLYMNQSPILFISEQSDGITPRTLQRWIKELCNLTGINKKITPHSYRHGKAHDMLDENPGCVKDIQEQLGHSEENPRAAFSYLRLHRATAEKRGEMYLKRTRAAYRIREKVH